MEDPEAEKEQIEVSIGLASVLVAIWCIAAIVAFTLFMVGLLRMLS